MTAPDVRTVPDTAASGVAPEVVGANEAEAREAVGRANPEQVEAMLARAEPKAVARRSFFQDTPDRGLFLAFAAGGFGLVLLMKLSGTPPLAAAVTAVGVLVAYGVLTWRIPHYRLHPDRLGENCYYLGFLFTLASLSAALIAINQADVTDRGAVIERIIADFGVALFSTIAGVAARVAFMQIRREVEDLEEEIRNDLSGVASALKDNLWLAVTDIESFRLRVRQVMTQEMEALVGEQAEAVRKIRGEVKKVATAAERLTDRIDGIDVPPDLLVRQLTSVQSRLASLGDSFARTAEFDEQRQAAAVQLTRDLTEAVARLSETGPSEQARAAAAAMADTVARVSEQVRTFQASLVGLQQTYSTHLQQGLVEAQGLKALREAMEADLHAARQTLRSLQNAMSDVADGIVRRLGP